MELVGKITNVLQPQEGVGSNGNPWKVQPYVMETQEQYPRVVYFEVFGEERISKNTCEVGDLVTVSINIESREFKGRWYTTVRAWRIQQGDCTKEDSAPQQTNVIRPDDQPAQDEDPEAGQFGSINAGSTLPF